MSKQNEFNNKAIELTDDELTDVVGGMGAMGNSGNSALAHSALAQHSTQAQSALAQ
jgi:hypothetical protein